MKCFYPMCDKRAPRDSLFRVNAKGQSGIWACSDHIKNTDAKVDPRVRIVGLFPEASHPKIVYPAAVLANSRHPAAPGFLAWLQGPRGRKIFSKYGFTVLK